MSIVQRCVATLLGTTVLTAVMNGPNPTAMAQTAGDSASIRLDQIEVTSRRRAESLQDIPFSVDVQTARDLEQHRALDTTTALKEVQGAGVTSFGDRANTMITIRGVGPVQGPLSPDDSSVLTFVDGVPLPLGAANSAFLDVQRVEVLKGPQNVLFGRNTMAGAISVVPVEPSWTPSGHILAEYGTDATHRLEGAVGGALVPDKIAGRIAFRKSGANGYLTNLAGPDLGDDQTIAGRASLLFTPTDRIRWLVSANAERSNMIPVYLGLNEPGFERTAARNLGRDDNTVAVFNSKFEYAFDWSTLTVQTSYSNLDNLSTFNNLDFFVGNRISGLPAAAFSNPSTNFTTWDRKIGRFTQEVRLASPTDAVTSWLGGLAYYRDTADMVRTANLLNMYPTFSGRTLYDLTTTGYSGFGEVTHPIADRLKLSVGGRLTREIKDFSSDYFADPTTTPPPLFPQYVQERGETTYDFWTGRTALSYDWNNALTSFGSIARSYKPGGYATYNPLMFMGVARDPYESAKGLTYEIGGRATLLDGRLLLNGAVFHNDVKNEQILLLDATGLTAYYVNIDTKSTGAELSASYQLSPAWNLSGGVAYTHATLQNVTAALAATMPGLADGNKVPNVAPWSAKAAVVYRAPASSIGLTGPLGDQTLTARVGYNYFSERYWDPANTADLDAIHLVSMRVGLDWGTGEAYVFGENLLDQRYLLMSQLSASLTGGSVQTSSWSRGAVVGVGATLRF